jgi:hypothetical protein
MAMINADAGDCRTDPQRPGPRIRRGLVRAHSVALSRTGAGAACREEKTSATDETGHSEPKSSRLSLSANGSCLQGHTEAPARDALQERTAAVLLLDGSGTGVTDGDAGDDRPRCGSGAGPDHLRATTNGVLRLWVVAPADVGLRVRSP